jgi:putative transcriptional regulator
MGDHTKNRIKELRAKHGLTQEDLADKVEVTRQTIIAIESGKYNPSLDLAFKMSKIFKLPIEEIFEPE